MPDKYQEEIEEILKKADGLPSGKAPTEAENARQGTGSRTRVTKSETQVQQKSRTSIKWPTLSPLKVFLAGLALLLIGALWIRPLVWVGLAALVAAYLLFFVKPRSMPYEKRWRGKAMEDTPSSPWERFLRWLRS